MNNTSDLLNCNTITPYYLEVLIDIKFWVEGVAVCCTGIPGVVLNLIAICILSKRTSNKNNFNQLITTLIVFDTTFLLLTLFFPFDWRYRINAHFLYLIYPIRSCALSASTFMTVGIAHERYVAIKYPIYHRQIMAIEKFRRTKLMKYILSTAIWAIIFNIPTFFDLELTWRAPATMDTNHTNER